MGWEYVGQATSEEWKEKGAIRFWEVQGSQIKEAGTELSTVFNWAYSSFASENPPHNPFPKLFSSGKTDTVSLQTRFDVRKAQAKIRASAKAS